MLAVNSTYKNVRYKKKRQIEKFAHMSTVKVFITQDSQLARQTQLIT